MFWLDLTFEWYNDATVFTFCVCVKPTLGKDISWERLLDFSQKSYSESYLTTAMFKVPSQRFRSTLTTAFKKTNHSWRFYKHANSFIKTWVNFMKPKSTKRPWKLWLAKKYDPALHRKLQSSRWCFHFFETDLVFKSKPIFINILDSFYHSLFTFSPFDYLYSTYFEG